MILRSSLRADDDRAHGQAGRGADVVQRDDVARVGDADDDLVVGHARCRARRCRSTTASGMRVTAAGSSRVADQVDGVDAERVARPPR